MQSPAFSIIWAAFFLSLTVATAPVVRSLDNAPVLHFTLFRRGGKFAPIEHACDYVNMTYLAQELEKTESRFNLTQREVKGNKLVRKAKSNGFGSEENGLTMGEETTDGIWYINRPQSLSTAALTPCAVGTRGSRLATHHRKLKWT